MGTQIDACVRRLRLVASALTGGLGALMIAALAATALAAPSPLRYGTWTLNIAKSTFDPGPPPMSQMRKEELTGDAITTVVEGVDAKGAAIAYQFTVRPDGRDYPLTGIGVPYGSDTVAFVDVDPFTIDAIFKKGGKVTGTARSVMSRDGKTLTVQSKGANAAGRATNNVTIWDKHPD